MGADSPLNSRQQEILSSIVRAYIESGEPVASRTISRQRREAISAATIRNEMADLADSGYLSQPHASAGRVPTEKAFRHYVGTLSVKRSSTFDVEQIRQTLSSAATVEDRVEQSSHLLSEITRNVGIASALPGGGATLDQIELLALADRRVLMVVATRDHLVRNRVVLVDRAMSQEELNSIRNYLNHNFAGWRLCEARRELLRRIAEERAAYDEVLSKLAPLYNLGLLDIDTVHEVHLDGVSSLMGTDLHLTREKMRELLRALEEKQRLVALLEQFLEQSASGELQVRVGLEGAHPAMRNLSLIGMAITLPSGLAARIAVLGPLRMHYERAMAAVFHISQAFGAADNFVS